VTSGSFTGGVWTGDVTVTEPFITIAGQTAPGGGITIEGRLLTDYTLERPVHDVVVRHLRVRAKPGLGNQGDAVQFSIVYNAVLDHLSLAWAEDETIAAKSAQDIAAQAQILDAMGMSDEAVVVTHVGGLYGDRQAALERFARRYEGLPEPARRRLCSIRIARVGPILPPAPRIMMSPSSPSANSTSSG
jgi:hypothetical protein